MVPAVDLALRLLAAGAGNLAAYLAAHVLLCLVPAFFIAGAMAALIPKASITRWLGRTAPLHVSYPVAAAAGSLPEVLFFPILPPFAGIHRKGSGLGPAITFLFFAPAGNIMALAYTGSILGAEFALARFLLCLVFGIGIGLLIALIFWGDDASHDARTDALFAERASIAPAAVGLLFSLVALLIAGTLKFWPLTATLGTVDLPLAWAEAWQATLFDWVPFDEAKGEEGVSVQGSLLILLLLAIVSTALCWFLWVYALKHLHTGAASMGMLAVPVVALVSAHWHFDERTAPAEYLGFALIGAALAVLSARAWRLQREEVAPIVAQD